MFFWAARPDGRTLVARRPMIARVLIADDEASLRKVLAAHPDVQHILAAEGYSLP